MFRRSLPRRIDMVKAFSIEDVTSSLNSPQDLVFFRMSAGQKKSFFAWPGLGHEEAAAAMLQMPEKMMTCHTLFGRKDTPVHIALDFDRKLSAERIAELDGMDVSAATEQRDQTFRSMIEEVVPAIDSFVTETKNEKIARQCILRSPNLKKTSFHLHIELEGDKAFDSVQALGEWLAPLKETIPEIDLQIYRNLGMLRMYKQAKDDGSARIELYEGIPELNIGFDHNDQEAKDAEAMRMSFIVAEGKSNMISASAAVASLNNPFGAPDGGYAGDRPQSKYTAGVRPIVVNIPSENEGIVDLMESLAKAMPQEYRDDYGHWIAAGLMLKRIAFCMDQSNSGPINNRLLAAWDAMSQGGPTYEPGGCEKRWLRFDGNHRPEITQATAVRWFAKRSDFGRSTSTDSSE